MKCPSCEGELKAQKYRGMPVEECMSCLGMWLTPAELDGLEDAVLDIEEGKGTMIFEAVPSQRKCPVCSQAMKKFNYRFYDLELDFCGSQHGFWLDKGEEQRILELMKKEADNMDRSARETDGWSRALRILNSKSVWAKLYDAFHSA